MAARTSNLHRVTEAQRARRATPNRPPDGSSRQAGGASRHTGGGAPAQERELRAQGKKTMRKLLDASMTVFDKRGYHAARVDDIVKVARTSHGTFYLYFANKEDLFRALVTGIAEEMMAISESLGPITPDRSGYESLRDWLLEFSEVYGRYGPVIRAWTEAASTEDGEFGSLGLEVTSGFGRTLSKRIREANLAPGIDPKIATLALVAMVERFHYYLLTSKLDIDRYQVAGTLAMLAHQGLFGCRTES
jgi:AcrR family transcriptional regulator